MKDYSTKENKKNFIVKIIKNEQSGTFDVIFADGSRFNDVEANEANLQKVIETQDKQAKIARQNKAKFVRKRKQAGIMTALSAGTMLAGTAAVSNIPFVEQMLAGQNPLEVVTGIGVITILGSIPAFAKLVRECGKVTELEKLDYYSANKEKLDKYSTYHNGLNGLAKKTAEFFRTSKDPFSILSIDKYDKSDLEIMMDNITKEDSFGFSYKK